MHQLTRFNIRIYGILMNDKLQVLLSDEVFRNGGMATKYPGGGLELGEGPVDCLKREFKEEAEIEVEIKEHFYTTDFFVPSFFDNESQVISIYYLVESTHWQQVKVSDKKFDFNVKPGEEAESFRWVLVTELGKEESINLPIDKIVTQKLIQRLTKKRPPMGR